MTTTTAQLSTGPSPTGTAGPIASGSRSRSVMRAGEPSWNGLAASATVGTAPTADKPAPAPLTSSVDLRPVGRPYRRPVGSPLSIAMERGLGVGSLRQFWRFGSFGMGGYICTRPYSPLSRSVRLPLSIAMTRGSHEVEGPRAGCWRGLGGGVSPGSGAGACSRQPRARNVHRRTTRVRARIARPGVTSRSRGPLVIVGGQPA
jgi:hypothetical protein